MVYNKKWKKTGYGNIVCGTLEHGAGIYKENENYYIRVVFLDKLEIYGPCLTLKEAKEKAISILTNEQKYT